MMREEWSLAGFWDRWFGDFYDGMIALVVGGVAYLLVDRPLLHTKAGFLDHTAFGATEVVLWLWFFWNWTYLLGSTGQSWGRRVAGLKVVNAEGAPIGFWRALGRSLFAIYISAPRFYLGFLWVIWDAKKQAWHDKVFRTLVVRRVQF